MDETSVYRIEISYHRPKDILIIHLLPKRPARLGGGEHDFWIRYDWDDPAKVVGFEVWDFSLMIPQIYNPEIVPGISMKFSMSDQMAPTYTLQEVLEWAYLTFVLRQEREALVA